MAKTDFELRLEGLYADAPEAPDAAAFLRDVNHRLDANRRRRAAVLGGFGAVGGLIAGASVATFIGRGSAVVLGAVQSLNSAFGVWLAVTVSILALCGVAARTLTDR